MLWMFERAGKKNPNNITYQFWHQNNQTIVMNDKYTFEQKLKYIHENPVRVGFVDNPVSYPYSSAIDYSEKKGYVKVVLAK